jgi:cell division ATPase FtsA
VLTGGTAQLEGIEQLFIDVTGHRNVRLGRPVSDGFLSDSSLLDSSVQDLNHTCALGLMVLSGGNHYDPREEEYEIARSKREPPKPHKPTKPLGEKRPNLVDKLKELLFGKD